ncbi:TPA: hypothetical protein DDW35_03875, partial [Candidatus Sumerlaeota bacterium]|nr:hypothetical protein [Candidatus Sumerlaeota bacterium]
MSLRSHSLVKYFGLIKINTQKDMAFMSSNVPPDKVAPHTSLIINPDSIPRFVLLICLCFLLIVPFKITSYGYLPGDDAMRHAGKVISGKDWQEILVMRPEITMDSHPGWHFLLGLVYKVIGPSANVADSLVCFSVITIFLIFAILPLFWMRRPEAWLLSLLAIAIFVPSLSYRVLIGRPFVVTMIGVLYLCFVWRQLRIKKTPWKILIGLVVAVTLSTWIHCSWFLWALPIAAFFLAREWRGTFRLIVCVLIGVVLGA